MNSITLYPDEVSSIEIEGIDFRDNTFIEMLIDGTSMSEMLSFEHGTIYWPELKSSIEKSGKYLIFTCFCGIADDSGWEEIQVSHSDNKIEWAFERNGLQKYSFDKEKYLKEILACENMLNLSQYPLAIEQAVFPE